MKTAKAMVFTGAGKKLELRHYPVPSPEPNGIVVRMTMATICGSDLHTFLGKRPGEIPGILGHEIIGEIISLESKVKCDALKNPLKKGDRVTWSIAASCGECVFCTKWNIPQKCLNLFKYGHAYCNEWPHFVGGFGEVVYLRPGTTVIKIPDHLSNEVVAPINCALSTVVHAVEKLNIHKGDKVLIQGAGMLGIYASAYLKEIGVSEVFVADIEPSRLKVAEKFGAIPVLVNENDSTDLKNQIMAKTSGYGLDAVLEVCGVAKSVQSGLELLRTGGNFVSAGLVFPESNFTIDGQMLIKKMITISGIHNYRPDHLIKALDFICNSHSKYPFENLISQKYKLEDVNEALLAAQNKNNIRVAIH